MNTTYQFNTPSKDVGQSDIVFCLLFCGNQQLVCNGNCQTSILLARRHIVLDALKTEVILIYTYRSSTSENLCTLERCLFITGTSLWIPSKVSSRTRSGKMAMKSRASDFVNTLEEDGYFFFELKGNYLTDWFLDNGDVSCFTLPHLSRRLDTGCLNER